MATDITAPGNINQIIEEIKGEDEKSRRSEMKRREEIYRDGGKRFLIEQIRREFDEDAVKEMRLAPLNLLKKIINKRSSIYKKSPNRTTELPADQALVDFYVEKNEMDQRMSKANRYFNLYSNTSVYVVPRSGIPQVMVVPPFLYSVVPNDIDRTQPDVWIFNSFVEISQVLGSNAIPSAVTGREGFDRNRKITNVGDMVASEEFQADGTRQFIMWTDHQHVTTDNEGNPIAIPDRDDSQFVNPIGRAPAVNLAKDRDNEFWARQGDDMIDLTMAIQSGWTDLLTIAKHQGFSILTVISEEEPRRLTVGVNRAVWLKQRPEGKDPSISYVTSSSPLAEYKDLLIDLLGLLLSTNDMNPSSVGRSGDGQSVTSGFQALLAMLDTLEAVESDKPAMKDAEKDTWDIIAKWHNWMFDNDMLREDARALGKFSEDFTINVQFSDMKPIESDAEKITNIKTLLTEGLITKKDAIRKLHPDMDEEAIDAKLEELEEEVQSRVNRMFGGTDGQEGEIRVQPVRTSGQEAAEDEGQ